MTNEERRVREAALREAAGVARIYVATKPVLDKSTNEMVARAFATVTSHTAEAIERDILKLIDQEPGDGEPGIA